MDRIEEDIQAAQCLICKKIKRDWDAVYTSDGEMICAECVDWFTRDKKSVE